METMEPQQYYTQTQAPVEVPQEQQQQQFSALEQQQQQVVYEQPGEEHPAVTAQEEAPPAVEGVDLESLTLDEIIPRLDCYFSQPHVTTAVGSYFQGPQVVNFVLPPSVSEDKAVIDAFTHPPSNYSAFQEYAALIEHVLEEFCQVNGIPVEYVAHWCQEAFMASDAFTTPANANKKGAAPMRLIYLCVDYIAAALDYEDFVALVAEMRGLDASSLVIS